MQILCAKIFFHLQAKKQIMKLGIAKATRETHPQFLKETPLNAEG